ncbi:MAG TPA: hypothetical protein PKD98_23885 [Anaerolineae bacterium]|nr:hypothetical protein [Anaerolineae bacterium]
MYNPVIIILVSMLGGFAVLIGLNHLVNQLDDRLRQRRAPLSFKRWPPSVRPVSDQVLEIGEYSSVRWDQVPALLLGGFMVVAILVALYPWPTPGFFASVMGMVGAILLLTLVVSLWLRSRHTYYRLDLTSGQMQVETRTFGWRGKPQNYLLKLPVQASIDCQYKDDERRDAFLNHATCWLLKNGQRLTIIHRNAEEAHYFRTELSRCGCAVPDHIPAE